MITNKRNVTQHNVLNCQNSRQPNAQNGRGYDEYEKEDLVVSCYIGGGTTQNLTCSRNEKKEKNRHVAAGVVFRRENEINQSANKMPAAVAQQRITFSDLEIFINS